MLSRTALAARHALHGPVRHICTTAPAIPPAKFTAKEEDANTRLDRFIKRRAPGLPPNLIQRLIRKRRILVNDTPAIRNAHPVRVDDEVTVPGEIKLGLSRRGRKPGEEDVSLAEMEMIRGRVLHRDARCAVLHKPVGLPMQGGTGVGERHLERLLPGLGGGRFWLVHRLDRDVGGVVAVARDVGAAGLLAKQFRERKVRKVYWGLLDGVPRERGGLLNMDVDGKRAETKWRIVSDVGGRFCWVELEPITGRKHQLRVHCARGLGIGIVGDSKYWRGIEDEGGLGSGMWGGLHLFAREIEFEGLTRGGMVKVVAELEGGMKQSWMRLGLKELI